MVAKAAKLRSGHLKEKISKWSTSSSIWLYIHVEKQHKTACRGNGGKVSKAANAAWEVMKKAGRDRRDDRIYLMNSLVRSVALYRL